MKRRKIDLLKLRKSLKFNQTDFWGAVGVSQCSGSRYEHGRVMPLPVYMLVAAVYLGVFLPSLTRGKAKT